MRINTLANIGFFIVAVAACVMAGIFIACTSILSDCSAYGNAAMIGGVQIKCEIVKGEK